MSLFEGLFQGGGSKKPSSLFKDSSKFNRSNIQVAEEPQYQVTSRKRKVRLCNQAF